jgi:hypothetical protein
MRRRFIDRDVTTQRVHRLWVHGIALTALVGATTQVPGAFAYAAPSRSTLSAQFSMRPIQYRTTLCTGDKVSYQLAVYVAVSGGDSPGTAIEAVQGVSVEASAGDPALGAFTPSSNSTVSFDGGPATADFTFKVGKKPGSTNLDFQGAVKGYEIHVGYVSFRVPIRIIECKFRVSGVLRFPADTASIPIPGPPLVAVIKPKQLTADSDGHLSGSAIIHWNNASASASIGGVRCTAAEKFGADGEVIVNGDVSDDGILTLTFDFPEAKGTITTSCAGNDVPPQPYPYLVHQVTVRIATKGGLVRTAATYKDSSTSGSATIVVKKVKAG